VEAHEKLLAEGIRTRVVSMPSWEIFDHQSQEYRDSVLPPRVKARVAVEQGSTLGWERYVGESGRIIGMKTFGGSAPLKEPPPAAASGGLSPSDLAEDRRLGDEAHDAHPLPATAQERIDLVDATDQPCPRFPADRKPGTFRSRGVERFVFRRDLDEDLALTRDSAVGIRVGPVVGDGPLGEVSQFGLLQAALGRVPDDP
jgi:hypothetical protein